MLKKLLSKKHQKWPAQALVEFALVALVFLTVVVMIIEVARIMQAYVTIQHAAREAARYAITGEFDPKYGVDPLAGWTDLPTTDPLKKISPCWPIFWDDHYDPALVYGAASPILYQPFRGPRTCSTEETAIRSMAGLILNPNAGITDPDYYEVIVSGTTTDMEPTSGAFQRGNGTTTGTPPLPVMETKNYLEYYHDPGNPPGGPFTPGIYAGDNPGGSRGYAGDPGQKVTVQIEYRIRIITPLLNNIAQSVKLNAIATMTVETFGSTGLQREAVLPPPDIKPQKTTSEITPPDLYISSFTCPAVTYTPSDIMQCNVEVRNQGDTPAGGIGKLWVYRIRNTTQTPLDFPFSPGPTLGVFDIGPLAAGSANSWVQSIPMDFLTEGGGTYYIYVWADATGTFDADYDGAIKELYPGYTDHARVTNNLDVEGPITVQEVADLSIEPVPDLSVSNTTPGEGETLTYTVKVKNYGSSTATNVTVSWAIPTGGLTCAVPCSPDATYDAVNKRWNLGNLAKDAVVTLTLRLVVDTGTSGQTLRTDFTASSSVPEPPSDPNPNARYLEVFVNSVDVGIAKIVTPSEVDFNVATPVTYTVTATNSSGTTAPNVVITDTLSNYYLPGITATGTNCTAIVTG